MSFRKLKDNEWRPVDTDPRIALKQNGFTPNPHGCVINDPYIDEGTGELVFDFNADAIRLGDTLEVPEYPVRVSYYKVVLPYFGDDRFSWKLVSGSVRQWSKEEVQSTHDGQQFISPLGALSRGMPPFAKWLEDETELQPVVSTKTKDTQIAALFYAINAVFPFVAPNTGVTSDGQISTKDHTTQIINIRFDDGESATFWKDFLHGVQSGTLATIRIDGHDCGFNAGCRPSDFRIISNLNPAGLTFAFADTNESWAYLNWVITQLRFIASGGKSQ